MSQELPHKKYNRKRNLLFTFKPNRSPIVYVLLCRQKSHVFINSIQGVQDGFLCQPHYDIIKVIIEIKHV